MLVVPTVDEDFGEVYHTAGVITLFLSIGVFTFVLLLPTVLSFSLEMGTKQPMALIDEGAYINDFPGYVIYVGRKKENIIEDATLYALDTNGNVISSLRAQKSVVKGELQEKKLLLDLYNVRTDPSDPTNIRPGTSAQRYPVPTP